MKGHLEIIRPGPFCTLQDLGRVGFQEYGFTVSGAVDEHAFRWANALLNNPQNTPSLEITLGMFSAKFSSEIQVCICGAEAKVLINNIEHALWTVLNIGPDDILDIRLAKSGFKLYLSVKNGFVAPSSLNSHSMSSREGLGLNKGQAFKAHQTLTYQSSEIKQSVIDTNIGSSIATRRTIDQQYLPDYSEQLELSVIPSPEFNNFSKEQRQTLFNNQYRIQVDSNRMGYRLSGEPIFYSGPITKSNGVTLGTIQITNNGQPIILLKDHQTIGGYPQIGTVSQLDCFKLGQKRPGENVSFRLSSWEKEEAKLHTFLSFFSGLED